MKGEITEKEVIVTQLREGLKNATEALRIAGIHAEIRTEDQV
jgi:hypothetical protein